MFDEIDPEQFFALQEQVTKLSTDLVVHKALILGLLSELGTDSLQEFSTFRNVVHSEINKLPPQSDEQHAVIQRLNEFLVKALHAADSGI